MFHFLYGDTRADRFNHLVVARWLSVAGPTIPQLKAFFSYDYS